MSKTISIIIPTYNEQENIVELTDEVKKTFKKDLPKYKYEIVFIDNSSTDNTQDIIRVLCANDKDIKAIFNVKNFGPFNSPYYGLFQGTGDCSILLCADFQDPIEMLPKFVEEWEAGHKIVCGVKTTSKENPIMYALRNFYYKVIKKMSEVQQISNFTGFALYDKAFLDVISKLNDPTPFLRGIVAEFGYNRKDIEYTQNRRKGGKSSYNFYKYYDAAMLSFTSYTKIGLRVAIFSGFIISILSFLVGIGYFIYKLIYWDRFVAGIAPLVIGFFFMGALQLFFIGLLGEYVLSINKRIMNRPLVVEAERINFE